MQDQPIPGLVDTASREAVRAYGVMYTLRALERLALAPYSAPELADILKVEVRTARRLLKRLHVEGYVVQEDGYRRRYRATLRLAALGRQVRERSTLARAVAPWAAYLTATTASMVHLWIPGAGEPYCVIHSEAGCELPRDEATSPAVVLHPDRRSRCSQAFAGDSIAAAVLDCGRVVGALGVTGVADTCALAEVVSAASGLSRCLAALPTYRVAR
jgi:DNA-binding MarR family transcriptional regulator